MFLNVYEIVPHNYWCRLEDPDAPETKEFVAKQVELANSVLAECEYRETMKKKVTSLYNYPRYGCPYKRGNYFFHSHNSGLQAQNVLYIMVQCSQFVVGTRSSHYLCGMKGM
jgi:prolyl oligopeptidase